MLTRAVCVSANLHVLRNLHFEHRYAIVHVGCFAVIHYNSFIVSVQISDDSLAAGCEEGGRKVLVSLE